MTSFIAAKITAINLNAIYQDFIQAHGIWLAWTMVLTVIDLWIIGTTTTLP
ncbi:MAG: hypothetical protein VKJ64_14310 [Leptolyngbyaceae bacterium]|nr:hypothetical protein [Leptolyngbyaceae bacterium]